MPDYAYTYDAIGNITEMGTTTATETDIQEFSYDSLNRLNAATSLGGGSVAGYGYEYAYDPLGNLTKVTKGGVVSDFNYDSPPAQPHAMKSITGGMSGSFGYDNNGNMTSRTESGITYSQQFDVENRLTSVTVTGATTEFYYDADGQRIMAVKPDDTIIYHPFPFYEEEVRQAPPTPTNTPTNTPTATSTPAPTNTPTATPTNTPLPTNTPTDMPLPTNTPTDTPLPTNTPTNTPLPTNTPTNTPTPTADPGSGRVTAGLQTLYTFQEGGGSVVNDVSGVGAPLDLTIGDTNAVTWLAGGGLAVDTSTLIASAGAATKVIDAAKASHELTVEAWVQPANITQGGPARIVTLSADSGYRNFTLGQNTDYLQVRLRTTTSTLNGLPALNTPAGTANTGLLHLVFTRDASGTRQVYVNNTAVANDIVTGDFSNWDAAYRLGLANELTEDRPWLGEIYLAAVYDRALTAAEVEQNFNADADANGRDAGADKYAHGHQYGHEYAAANEFADEYAHADDHLYPNAYQHANGDGHAGAHEYAYLHAHANHASGQRPGNGGLTNPLHLPGRQRECGQRRFRGGDAAGLDDSGHKRSDLAGRGRVVGRRLCGYCFGRGGHKSN